MRTKANHSLALHLFFVFYLPFLFLFLFSFSVSSFFLAVSHQGVHLCFLFFFSFFHHPSSVHHPSPPVQHVHTGPTCTCRVYILQSELGLVPGGRNVGGGGWGRNINTIFTITILNLYFLAASFPLFLVCFVWVERRWYILLWVGLMWTKRRTKGRDS